MDLEPLVASLERSISIASEFLDHDALAPHAEVTQRTRNRVGYLGESVVVALAGGTGSGKSSLLNAIAGEVVAAAGVVRPTTSQALAWLPHNPEPGLVRLLDDMSIDERVGHRQERALCVLDMPDTDSIEGAHRATFERLLPLVDAIVWVVDPEKYSDRVLHADYLKPLARYEKQFLFVMNQIDRLSDLERQEVMKDFERLLKEDGITDPLVLALAADPPGESPRNIPLLLEVIDARWEEKALIHRKLVTDLARSGESLRDEAGLDSGSLGFDRAWLQVLESVQPQLTEMVAGQETVAAAEDVGAGLASRAGSGPVGSLIAITRHSQLGRMLGIGVDLTAIERTAAAWNTRPGLQQVLVELEQFAADMAFRAGGPFARRIRTTFDGQMAHRLDAAVNEAQTMTSSGLVPLKKRWWSGVSILKWLLVAASLASAVWWWANPIERGEWPWPVIVIALSVVIGLALSRAVDLSGRRSGRALAVDFQEEVSGSVSEGLNRSIGSPMRLLLLARAELDAELAQLAIEAEAILREEQNT